MKTKYILLDVGDIVEDGDQEYKPDEHYENNAPYNWFNIFRMRIGEVIQENDPPVRRKVK
jgi:hypothetical protein